LFVELYLKKLLLLVLAGALCLPALSQTSAEPVPYVLANTEVHNLAAPQLKRDYQVWVSLPKSYRSANKRYPVVFVTDAPYAFPLVRSLAARLGNDSGGVEEFILVGLSYATGDSPEFSRRRDYTPSQPADPAGMKSDMPGRTPQFGEAESYRNFIAEQVFPLVAKLYRADMSRKVFAGHSYGSLLGAHILLTEPSMFRHYILGSPSFWYGRKLMFEREKSYADQHQDLAARVYFAVGSFETVKPGSKDARYNESNDLVADMHAFEKALKARKYPGLQLQSKVLDDEDHLSVAPAILTRGLKWALPASK
jgi:predicted alpha/beta superfamily hydrolase